MSIIKELSTGCEMKTVTMDYITENLKQKVYDTYCTDIKIYDRAKQFRFKRRFLGFSCLSIENNKKPIKVNNRENVIPMNMQISTGRIMFNCY